MSLIDAIYLPLSFAFGLCLGSFATALSWRLPRGISIVREKDKAAVSRCPSCQNELRLRDLIPLFSWLCMRGKCRHCATKISVRYPLIELATALFCLAAYLRFGQSLDALLVMASAPIIISLIAIDLEHYIIPDTLNIGLAVIGLIGLAAQQSLQLFLHGLGGALIFFLIFFLLRFIFMVIMKREALGLGDVKMFAALGLWLEMTALPLFLMISGLSGIVLSLFWQRFTGSREFPFGPSLALSFVICIFFSDSRFLF